jgi:hypothetical protein
MFILKIIRIEKSLNLKKFKSQKVQNSKVLIIKQLFESEKVRIWNGSKLKNVQILEMFESEKFKF